MIPLSHLLLLRPGIGNVCTQRDKGLFLFQAKKQLKVVVVAAAPKLRPAALQEMDFEGESHFRFSTFNKKMLGKS